MKLQLFSKISKFYVIGASGLCLNYLISLLLNDLGFWYLYSNLFGIIFSMNTNFLFNKIWTFDDRIFIMKRTMLQYLKFIGFSSISSIIQITLVYLFVEYYGMLYQISLIVSVLISGMLNFILNKTLTFNKIK